MMKTRGIISIETKAVIVPDTEVWMTAGEIAGLFHVRGISVESTIRKLLKEGIVKEYESCRHIRLSDKYGTDVYNMEIVIALSFKFDTGHAALFRKWLMETTTKPKKEPAILFLHHPYGTHC